MDAKKCSRCGVDKPASDFSPDRRAPDGLQPACKECYNRARKARRDSNLDAAHARERANYAANKDRILASNARYRAADPDGHRAKKRAAYHERYKNDPEFVRRLREHTAANKEWKREYDRQYRASIPKEVQNERALAWAKANPEKRKAIRKASAAKRRAVTDQGVGGPELLAWLDEQVMECVWCGVECADDYHIDHVIPLAKGGEHEVINLAIACPPCNLRKNAKMPDEFVEELRREQEQTDALILVFLAAA